MLQMTRSEEIVSSCEEEEEKKNPAFETNISTLTLNDSTLCIIFVLSIKFKKKKELKHFY